MAKDSWKEERPRLSVPSDAISEEDRQETSSMKDMLLRQIQVSGNQESFHLADLAHIRNKVQEWRYYFPHIEPFYAMKCNPDPIIIQTLRESVQ